MAKPASSKGRQPSLFPEPRKPAPRPGDWEPFDDWGEAAMVPNPNYIPPPGLEIPWIDYDPREKRD